ncbi:MAG: hypothetical protein GW949_10735 [Spirochaetales bacterium]|nr:hypothetical protein [Spirochaetales bacterium]
MNIGELGNLFSLPTIAQRIRNPPPFASFEHEARFLKRCRYAFDEAHQSLGFQDLDTVSWVVSPGTLLLTSSSDETIESKGLPLSSYGFGFFRPRTDGELVITLNGHDQPMHSPAVPPDPDQDYMGSPQGLLWGLQKLARGLDYQGGGFDGYIEIPQIDGNPFVPELTFGALVLYAYFSQNISHRSQEFITSLTKTFAPIFESYHGIRIHPRVFRSQIFGSNQWPDGCVWIPFDTNSNETQRLVQNYLEKHHCNPRALGNYVPWGPGSQGSLWIGQEEDKIRPQELATYLTAQGIRALNFVVPQTGTFSIEI